MKKTFVIGVIATRFLPSLSYMQEEKFVLAVAGTAFKRPFFNSDKIRGHLYLRTVICLQVNKYVPSKDQFRGRIINLSINCNKQSAVSKRRLLFKFEGTLQCKFVLQYLLAL